MTDPIQVRCDLLTCHKCELNNGFVRPVPWSVVVESRYLPSSSAGIVVIGEAPGRQENEKGVPFIGPAGQLARSWFRSVGINPLDIGYMNVVSCYPSGTPTPDQVTACVPNVRSQLDVLRPRYVVVFGAVALGELCPVRSVTMTALHGHFWTLNYGNLSALAMATWHPAAVLRDRSKEKDVLLDLECFGKVVDRELDPAPNHLCARCGKEPVAVVVDRLGLGEKCKKYARPIVKKVPLPGLEMVAGPERHRQ